MRTAPRICCQPTPRTVAQVALPRSTLAALQSVGLSLALWGCADLLGDVSVEATASVSERPLREDPSADPAGAAAGVGADVTGEDASGAVSRNPVPGDGFNSDLSSSPQLVTTDAPCVAGDVRCLGPVRQLCAQDGDAWVALEGCASDSLCSSERCLQPICAAHALRRQRVARMQRGPGRLAPGLHVRHAGALRLGREPVLDGSVRSGGATLQQRPPGALQPGSLRLGAGRRLPVARAM